MKIFAIFLCVLAQVFLVSGQLLFKKAMEPKKPQSGAKTALLLILGIGTQTAWFFLWDTLLEKQPLSRIYPFEGINPAILAVLALIVLKEKLPLISWCGLLCICAGIAIVSAS